MNPRAFAIGLVCLASFASQGAGAQGVRLPGAGGARLPAPVMSAPADAGGAARQADFIVAVVNSEPVTNHEVRQRLARLQRQVASQGGAQPPRELLAREALEQLILERVQSQLAREGGIAVDELSVDQAEQSVARQNEVSTAEMYRRLAADGISREQFRQELRRQLMQQRLREREVDARVRVSEQEIDQFLREQSAGTDQAQLELSLGHVLVSVPEGASPAQVASAQARAQAVADKARAGGDFAALAREFSDARDAAAGGLMGLRTADRYPDLFVEATQALSVGGVAGPVRSGAGFHVLKVFEKTRAGLPATVTQSHARHILLRTGAQLSERAAAERLQEYRRRIQAGQADFAALAREHSQDGSAKQGGDLGWSNPGNYVPEFEEAMNRLQPGEIAEPLVSRFGVHLIQLLERREARLNPREQREMVRHAVRQKKIEEAYATWAQEVRGRAYVEFRDPPQ
ncbi:peptidylprolyl isomerase [Simplicispira lacusdiani]|jgi:peptidyl-prolyl cis-trans isomerase SurA|uniref:peptidylprolyl isomerase n=1 Tax=Simplicispira lacusdiani TaxID=2213010 RepID=UPI000E72B717|nr:peptidylprolyl isomerase [Simplicispira lacusdiani]